MKKIILFVMGMLSLFKSQGQELDFYHASIQKEILEILNKSSDTVLHSPVPFELGFDAGGGSDIYIYENHFDGIAYLTTDLTGKKQIKSSNGNYELMICHKSTEIWGSELISKLAYYTLESRLESGQTMDLGGNFLKERSQIKALIFDKYASFKVGGKKYGILLLIGITKDELDWAKNNSGQKLIEKLKEKKVYPITDLNRTSVFKNIP